MSRDTQSTSTTVKLNQFSKMSNQSYHSTPNSDTPPAARQVAPLIGIQLRSKVLASTPEHAARYDSAIMHRVVPPTLEQVTVSLDASCCDIAATFSLPLSFVASHWLTSRSPMELPGYHKAVIHQTPSFPISRTKRPHHLSTADLSAYRQHFLELSSKLAIYADTQPEQDSDHDNNTSEEDRPRQDPFSNRPSRARLERMYEEAVLACNSNNSTTNSNNMSIIPNSSFDSTHQSSTALSTPPLTSNTKSNPRAKNSHCGFLPTTTHPELALRDDTRLVTKPSDGLYRRALAAAPLQSGSVSYTELFVCRNDGHGGLCLGVAPSDAPLARLPLGGYPSEIGYHSSGQLISSNGQWTDYGRAYGHGDTIGVLVEMPGENTLSDLSAIDATASPVSSASSANCSSGNTIPLQARVTFFVNGEYQGPVFVNVGKSNGEGMTVLHVAACLYRKGSSVEMKCCGTDWEYFPAAQAVCNALRPACRPRTSRSTAPVMQKGNKGLKGGIKQVKIETEREHGCTSDLTP